MVEGTTWGTRWHLVSHRSFYHRQTTVRPRASKATCAVMDQSPEGKIQLQIIGWKLRVFKRKFLTTRIDWIQRHEFQRFRACVHQELHSGHIEKIRRTKTGPSNSLMISFKWPILMKRTIVNNRRKGGTKSGTNVRSSAGSS